MASAGKMDLKRPIKVIVISCLICYTGITVYQAASKYREGKIGTRIRHINQETVEESAINVFSNAYFGEITNIMPTVSCSDSMHV